MKNPIRWLLLTLTLVALFCALGLWQLRRAETKEQLSRTHQQRQIEPPVQSITHPPESLLFRRGQLTGRWVRDQWVLLDNKIHEKRIGYEVYAVFKPHHYNGLLLVNLGFTPLVNRHVNPLLPKLPETDTTIHGFFTTPPRYFALGNMLEPNHQQPMKVQYINLIELEAALNIGKLNPAVFILDDTPPISLQRSWMAHTQPPEKHRGYAFQWFAIAFTLLLLFLTLFLKSKSRNSP